MTNSEEFNPNKDKVQFTLHAMRRAEELRLSVKDLLNAWDHAVLKELSTRQREYKFRQYGIASLDDVYFYHNPSNIMFTCNKKWNGLVVVITVTRKNLSGVIYKKPAEYNSEEDDAK